MADSRWWHVLTAAIVSIGASTEPWACAVAPHDPGLSVRADGALLREGVPYRGIGVNYFDAFARTLKDPNDTSYEAGFRALATMEFLSPASCARGSGRPRCDCTSRTRLPISRLDGMVHAAERYSIGLIPSLFWYLPTVPDLVQEPCDQWANPHSKTHEFMRTYTREVVTRYLDSPAIWAWEFGNEYNLDADLPNAKDHLPPIVPRSGTANPQRP